MDGLCLTGVNLKIVYDGFHTNKYKLLCTT